MRNMTISEFAASTASKSPVPGGGSMSALCGGLSAALVEMVSNLTIGRKKYIAVEDQMKEVQPQAAALQNQLLDLIEEDSAAFNLVMDAYRLPKDTQEQKTERSAAIQKALKTAAEVPMQVADAAYQVIQLSKIVVEKGNTNAVTDGLVSAMMARTAVMGALLNVRINLGSIKDDDYVQLMAQKADQYEHDVNEIESNLLQSVNL